ncbi:MAG: hypothetical protein HY927_11605 [Elusimicrobia bacterium]|nr:hypothetical protein [Elusimicrobiota bacterium]
MTSRDFCALAVCVFLLLGLSLRVLYLGVPAGQRTPDEKIYAQYARLLADEGLARGAQSACRRYLDEDWRWQLPPPTRLSYLAAGALALRAGPADDEAALAGLSAVFSVLSVALAGWLAWRFVDPWAAAAAVWFMAQSPLELVIARRAWQEDFLGFLSALAFCWAAEVVAAPGRLAPYFLLAATGCLCALAKESGVFVLLLASASASWWVWRERRMASKGALVLALGACGLAAALAVMAGAAGGWSPLAVLFGRVKDGMPLNRYAVLYQEAPWYSFIQGLWVLSPVPAVLMLAAIPLGLLERPLPGLLRLAPLSAWSAERRFVLRSLLFYAASFVFLAAFPRYMKNLRYLSPVYAPLYCLAGFSAWRVVAGLLRGAGKAGKVAIVSAAAVVLAWAAVRDHRQFRRAFIGRGVNDLSAGYLMNLDALVQGRRAVSP